MNRNSHRLAEDALSHAEAIKHYRRVRDGIRAFVENRPEALWENIEISAAARRPGPLSCSGVRGGPLIASSVAGAR